MDVLVVQVARESGSSLLSINRVVSFVLQASVVEAVAQDLEADRDSSAFHPSPTSSESSESFYISTDAGHLIHLQITPSPNGWTCSPHLISRRHPVSHLSLLPRQHQDQPNQDILILLGDMCDGEFLVVDYTAETVFASWTRNHKFGPRVGFQSLFGFGCENNNKSHGFIRKEKSGCGVGRDKMYLTSGCSPNGRIRELQTDADGSVSGDSAEGGFKGLLGISFLSETRLLYLLDDTLEDVSETSGLELHFASLLIASLEGGGNSGDMEDALVVQVWRGGVVVARPTYFEMQERQESVNWAVDCGEVVTLAAMYGQYLFLGIGKVVVLLHVSPTASDDGNLATIVQVSRITLEEEPSSLSCTILEGYSSTICLVGTYEPSVIVLEVNDSEELIRKESLSLASLSQGEIRVPNSIRHLTVGLDSFIAIGLRNGTLGSLQNQIFRYWDSSSPPAESSLPSSTNAIRRPPLQITSICFDTLRIGTPFHQSQSYLHSSNTQAWTYIFATPDSLSFVSLDVNNNNNSCPPPPRIRSLPITKTPRRIIHDTATGTLIIACNTRLRGKDVLTGEIKLVDPKTGVQYLREVLPKGEACYSMTIWNIKDQKRYICIGTWGYQENPGGGGASRSGRVLVYSLKETESRSENKPPFRIRKLGEYVLPEMVFAGNCLYQLKIEATSRTLHCGAKTELRYPIRSLSVSGSHIFVGGANDSISLYLFDARTKQFTFCKSDDITRSPSDCLSLSPTKVLVADKSGNVFCLGGGSDSSQITNNESLCFKTNWTLGFEGTSLGLVSLVEDEDRDQNLVADDDDNDNQENITLSVGNQPHHQSSGPSCKETHGSVYACSIVGSVFAFRGIKDSRVYTRLKELQNVLAVYPLTRPLLGNDYQRFRGGVVKMGKGLAGSGMLNVIDGDLVKRWSVLSVLEKKQVLDEMSGDDDEMLSWIDGFVEGLISMG
ncbi:CPSF A subunit region-domain-containing protein [Obelidium mucronatum]|nr:CPSF A subunit region-domain-containing protein [Obelidium mucronatum]